MMSCVSRTYLPSKTTAFFKIPWYHETASWKSLHVAVLISFQKGTAIMGIVMLLSSFPMWLHQITMVGNSFYTTWSTCIYTTYMYLYTCVHLSIHIYIWYIYRDTCISQDCFTMSELGPNLCERDGSHLSTEGWRHYIQRSLESWRKEVLHLKMDGWWWLIMVGSWKMWIVFPFLGWKVAQGKGAGSDYVWVSGSVLNSRELEVGWSLWGQRHHRESGLPRDDDASTCLCMEGCCGWAFDLGRWWYPSVTWGLK